MKFIADVMVGRLAKYLRMAGYDVAYINDIKDDKIIEIAKNEDRIILTRDRLMLERRDIKNHVIKSVFIKDDSLSAQLMQIKNELHIDLKPSLKRCIECNSCLEEIKKDNVRGKVPPYVYSTQDYFLLCINCKKLYWRGTHYKNISEFFSKLNSS
jgi:uncharacterized protein